MREQPSPRSTLGGAMHVLSDDVIYAYLAQALEPGEVLEVEEELAADPALRARVTALAGPLRDSEWVRDPARAPGRFMIPPPGLALAFQARAVPVQAMGLSADQLRPGDRFSVRIGPLADPEALRVAVLFRGTGAWRVMFPASAAEQITAADLPRDAEGMARIDLVAQPELGLQRWAIALAPLDLPVAWEQPVEARWAALERALEAGQLPVASLEVLVG
jgi:hypothetical protein